MLLTIALCVALVGVDQLLKYLAVQYLQPVGTAPLIPHVVSLRYLENDGAAFNILAGQQTLLIVVTGLVLAAVAVYILFRRPKDKLEYISIIMILSGGIGNLIDRVMNGYVVDYINLLFMRFAIFNFADMLVCVGFGLLVIAVVRAEIKSKKMEKDNNSSEDNTPANITDDNGDKVTRMAAEACSAHVAENNADGKNGV